MSNGELITRPEQAYELTIPELASKMTKLREVMRGVMTDGEDYGVIPGTKSKPTLLKPGAEKLGMMFRLAPEYDTVIIDLPDGHREYRSKCRLVHAPTSTFAGEASAICSTMESKYRYRGGSRKCPVCGKEAIKKSKFPPRDKPNAQPGYYCFAKIGGCGANFEADDQEIVGQSEQKTENPDIADSYNTVEQIAQKRAYVAAIKTVTASSELFTQDLEDAPGADVDHGHESEQRQTQPAKQPPPSEQTPRQKLDKLLMLMGCKTAEDANAVVSWATGGSIHTIAAAREPERVAGVLDLITEHMTAKALSPADCLRIALEMQETALV